MGNIKKAADAIIVAKQPKTTEHKVSVETLRRRESARILANQTARTKEVSGISYTSQDEDGRMALLILLSGTSLDRLARMQSLTAGEAAYSMATAIVAGLYPLKFSEAKDAVTGFVKAFLANNPEGRMKRYIKRFINSDEELKFAKKFDLGAIRRRIIERNAQYMSKEITRELLGNDSQPLPLGFVPSEAATKALEEAESFLYWVAEDWRKAIDKAEGDERIELINASYKSLDECENDVKIAKKAIEEEKNAWKAVHSATEGDLQVALAAAGLC